MSKQHLSLSQLQEIRAEKLRRQAPGAADARGAQDEALRRLLGLDEEEGEEVEEVEEEDTRLLGDGVDESTKSCYWVRLCCRDQYLACRYSIGSRSERASAQKPSPCMAPRYLFNVGVVYGGEEGEVKEWNGSGEEMKRRVAKVRLGRPCHCHLQEVMAFTPVCALCCFLQLIAEQSVDAPYTGWCADEEAMERKGDGSKPPEVDVDLTKRARPCCSGCVEYRYVMVDENPMGGRSVTVENHGMCFSTTTVVDDVDQFFAQVFEVRAFLHKRVKVKGSSAGGDAVYEAKLRYENAPLLRLVAQVGDVTLAISRWVRFRDDIGWACKSARLHEIADLLSNVLSGPPQQCMTADTGYHPPTTTS